MFEVINFINKRFNKDCNWVDGNCYYFTVILKDRFPEGKIYYHVIDGHFVFKYNDLYYDWIGIVETDECFLVEWDNFEEYDSLLKQRIIRDCIL